MRKVQGLKECFWCEAPTFSEGTKTAAQKKGLEYERRVQRMLRHCYSDYGVVRAGPWIRFRDNGGPGLCQPDLVIVPNDPDRPVIVVEIKLTKVRAAKVKLKLLYGRLVGELEKRKVVTIQVFKNKGPKGEKEVDFQEFHSLRAGAHRDCHWL